MGKGPRELEAAERVGGAVAGRGIVSVRHVRGFSRFTTIDRSQHPEDIFISRMIMNQQEAAMGARRFEGRPGEWVSCGPVSLLDLSQFRLNTIRL